MSTVYIFGFTVMPTSRSAMPGPWNRGVLDCYTSGDDVDHAIEKCLDAQDHDGFEVIAMDKKAGVMDSASWALHVVDRWPEFSDQMLTQDQFQERLDQGRVIFGPVGSYTE